MTRINSTSAGIDLRWTEGSASIPNPNAIVLEITVHRSHRVSALAYSQLTYPMFGIANKISATVRLQKSPNRNFVVGNASTRLWLNLPGPTNPSGVSSSRDPCHFFPKKPLCVQSGNIHAGNRTLSSCKSMIARKNGFYSNQTLLLRLIQSPAINHTLIFNISLSLTVFSSDVVVEEHCCDIDLAWKSCVYQ